jgi:alpha-ketoglutarate-dependent taurine dioxygenase
MYAPRHVATPPTTRVHEVRGQGAVLDVARDEVDAALKEHGALLLRGFDVEDQSFAALSERICGEFLVHPNVRREVITPDGYTRKVDPRTNRLPYHNEMSYWPNFPETIWFFCISPPSSGGETTVCDGVLALAALDQELRAFFEGHRIKYSHRIAPPPTSGTDAINAIDKWRAKLAALADRIAPGDVFEYRFDEHGTLHAQYITSAIRLAMFGHRVFANSIVISQLGPLSRSMYSLTFEDDSPLRPGHLDGIQRATDAVGASLRWEKRDILVLDNTRMMHGRREFEDPDRTIHVRIGNRQRG